MNYTPEEEERKKAIQQYLEGEQPVEIYRNQGRSKYWFYKWLNRYNTGHKEWYKNELKVAKVIPYKTEEKIERVIVEIRKALMDGMDDSTKYSRVGPEAIKFHMEGLGYKQSDIPSMDFVGPRYIKGYGFSNRILETKPNT